MPIVTHRSASGVVRRARARGETAGDPMGTQRLIAVGIDRKSAV
jgi:hypothetical protein